MRRARTRYASAQSTTLYTADGGSIDSKGKMQRGAVSQNKGGSLVYEDDPLTIEYRRDAGVNYETPAGEVVVRGKRDSHRNGRSSRAAPQSFGWCSLPSPWDS